jgi:glycosyltransferase involved in cell wall biosynthesis
MKKILLICDGGGVSEFYRSATPYRMLAQAGHIEIESDPGDNPALIDRLDQFDAAVFSRSDTDIHSLIIRECKMRGIRVIYDVDDNLDLIPPSIGVFQAWHVRGKNAITPRLWHFKRNVAIADILTVSTPALGRQLCDGYPRRLRERGDYLVLPNQILADSWRNISPTPEKKPGEVWVGWWGIYNHWDDWRDIAPYIEPVITARPEVRLVILGMPELSHLFPALVESGQLLAGPFIEPASLDGYRQFVAAFDIALAPTSPCPFNESKSDLKLLQYGAAGVPVIASEATYGDWEDRPGTIILYGPDQWGYILDEWLDDLDTLRAEAVGLRRHILQNRTYEANYTRWLEAIG